MRKLFLILMTVISCSLSLLAQTRTYHGTVLDAANNEPLIGATISPIGGGQGTAADIDGKFVLTVPSKVTQAKITYVGYKHQVVTLQNNMTIYLTSSSADLDDLVVVAYGTANKESLTGSVAVVGSKEIEDRPVTSVTSALEGNAPGVQVTSATTQPGQAPSIRVRGFSSVNGNNDALIVVDGSEYVGDIAAINPQDIESMSVLKDAASCALYGNRGANGVVLITTKKAKNLGKVDVTLQVRQGMYERALPMYDRMDANEWMETTFNAQVNGKITNEKVSRQDAINFWRDNFIPTYAKLNIYDADEKSVFDANGKLADSILPGYTGEDMDWWKGVSRTGYRQEYSVSMAGATEKFNAFASAGYLKENGYVLLTDYERFSGRVNLNANPVKFLKLGLNLSAAQQEMQRSPVDPDGLGYTNNPFSMTQNKAPIYPYYLHDEKGNVMYDPETGLPIWNQENYNTDGNIVWNIREDRRNYSVTQLDASMFGTIVLPYGFDITVKGTMFRDKTNEMQYNNNKIGSQANIGSLSHGFYRTKTHMFQQMLNWSHDYGAHHVDVLLDHENYAYSYEENYIRKSGQQLDGLIHMGNFAEMKDMTAYYTEYKLESYLGRARYNYEQKYFIEASIRRDGTSRFDKDNRWGTFWSTGASWAISKEKFMQDINWINFLKLRAAYGSVGNDASAGHYASWGIYNFGWAIGGSINNLVPAQLPPSNLRWESTKTFDLALEGSLFDDRFNFSIGYYNKRNTDLLFWRSSAPSSGNLGNTATAPMTLQNIGTMQNIGWELAFGVDIIRNQNIKWTFNVDASFLKNKIIKLPDNQDIPGDALFIGKSLYEQYTYEWAGIDRTNGRSLYVIDPESPDFYSYNDQNQKIYNGSEYASRVQNAAANGALVEIDGKYYTYNTAYASRKIIGTSLPTVYGSFGTNVAWKGISLGMLFSYSLGGKTYDGNYAGLTGVGSSGASALHKDLLNAWSQKPDGIADHTVGSSNLTYIGADGQPVSTSVEKVFIGAGNIIDPNGIPQLNTSYNSYSNSASSRYIVNNNYLIFKNLNLSYDLPDSWVRTMKLQNLNIGVSVDNVFIATKRKGINPQYNFSGGQGQYFVPSRVYSFQLTAKF